MICRKILIIGQMMLYLCRESCSSYCMVVVVEISVVQLAGDFRPVRASRVSETCV